MVTCPFCLTSAVVDLRPYIGPTDIYKGDTSPHTFDAYNLPDKLPTQKPSEEDGG